MEGAHMRGCAELWGGDEAWRYALFMGMARFLM